MRDDVVRRAPLGWLAGGVLLGLVQVAAVALKSPLGVSTQFVVADTQVLEAVAPAYVSAHPLISSKSYTEPGYGWWLDVGIVLGALVTALAVKRFRVSAVPAWWRANHGDGIGKRLLAGLAAGFLILFGARLAHGCTSGQFASGWAQLSLSAVPFTVALFGAAMLTARIVLPKTPAIDEGGQ
jgi:uncharacterized protein